MYFYTICLLFIFIFIHTGVTVSCTEDNQHAAQPSVILYTVAIIEGACEVTFARLFILSGHWTCLCLNIQSESEVCYWANLHTSVFH